MGTGWTVEIGAAGGSMTEYDAETLSYHNRLNAVGFFSLLLPHLQDPNNRSGANLSEPSERDLVRFIWDQGGSNEQVHFEGYITDIRRQTPANHYLIRGLDILGLLWQSTTGAIREYDNASPWDIFQQTTGTNGLILNAQGNNVPIGTTSLQAGSASDVPHQLSSTNAGVSMDFRADSSRSLLNLQRLLLQGKVADADYPSWVAASDTFGLEVVARLEDTNGDGDVNEPRIYLVERRERSSSYTIESYDQGTDMVGVRGTEGATAANAINVVGSGSGRNRVETSSIVGSGGLEGIVADKTLRAQTNADNMANRLSTLLDSSQETVTGWLFGHDHDTRVGDRVTITESGEADTTIRLFAKDYQLKPGGFNLTLGRPRPLAEDPFYQLGASVSGQGQAQQPSSFEVGPQTSLGSTGRTTLTASSTTSGEATTSLTSTTPSNVEEYVIRVILNDVTTGNGTGDTDWIFEVRLGDDANPFDGTGNQVIVVREWVSSFDPRNTGITSTTGGSEELELVYTKPGNLFTGLSAVDGAGIAVSNVAAGDQDIEVDLIVDAIDQHQHNP